jgi:cysteine desulfurase/selenocysteine lyase
VDVTQLDCDYYCFSGHKMLAPTGIGVLYGKPEALNKLAPVRFGGGMVDMVTEADTTWGPLPHRLEAGTPNIGGIIGLGSAIDYLQSHDINAIHTYEAELYEYTVKALSQLEHVRLLGHPKERMSVLSLTADGAHPYDIASMLDKYGVALRSGNHCAQPLLHALGETAALRISPAFYNTIEEIDSLCRYFAKAITMLRKYST